MIEVYAILNKTISRDANISLKSGYIPMVENKRTIVDKPRRTSLSRSLITEIIHEKLHIDRKNIIICHDLYGKPFLKNYEKFHFSISHSLEWTVCAIGTKPIGIDIQLIKPISINIAKRFFSDEEYLDIISMDNSERVDYFYDLWTLKESLIKAIGMGLSIPLNSFTIKAKGSGIELKNIHLPVSYYFKQYNIDERYKMAICCTDKNFPESIFLKSL
jgi:4'-phosphopantetheinyl transferase